MCMHTHSHTYTHSQTSWEKKVIQQQNEKHNWPSIKEKEMTEWWLVLTNTECDCPRQDSCGISHQKLLSAVPGAAMEMGSCMLGTYPQGAKMKTAPSLESVSWWESGRVGLKTWSESQAMNPLSVVTIMLHYQHSEPAFITLNIYFWSIYGSAGHFCCFWLGSPGLTHSLVVS